MGSFLAACEVGMHGSLGSARTARARRSALPWELTLAGGAASVFTVATLLPAVGAQGRACWDSAALVGVVAVWCGVGQAAAALPLAGIGWLCDNGLLENGAGVLRLHPADARLAGLFLSAAVLAAAVGELARWAASPTRRPSPFGRGMGLPSHPSEDAARIPPADSAGSAVFRKTRPAGPDWGRAVHHG